MRSQMDTSIEPMDSGKAKYEGNTLRRYWLIFIPLAVLLVLMVKFPLRIDVRELFYDTLFYGFICFLCIAAAFRVFQRFGKFGYRLIAVVMLCALLSGWQIFDLYVVRTGRSPSVYGFGDTMSPNFTDYDGLAWYGLRFLNDDIMCHSLYEQYYGNYMIAITVEISRDATWFACGG